MKIKVIEKKDDLEKIILGIESNPRRKTFHELIDSLDESFVVETEYKEDGVLPLIFVDDTLSFEGIYPKLEEMARVLNLDSNYYAHISESSDLFQAANNSRIGICCGVGTNVYFDPYENEDFE